MRVIPLILLLSSAACQAAPPPEMTDSEKAEIQATVAMQLQVWSDAVNALDATRAASIADPGIVFIDHATPYGSIQELVGGWTSLFSNYQSNEGRWDEVRVDVITPDVALFYGQLQARRQHVDGRVQETDPFVWLTGVFRLKDGEWRMTTGHLSAAMRWLPEEETG